MPVRWFDRKFELGLPLSAAPALIARLRAAAGRLEAATRGLSRDIVTHRPDGRWSIVENVGHLADLEALWLARLDDFDRGAAVMTPTDLQNRRTHEAGHNERALVDVLADFRTRRDAYVARVAAMDGTALGRTAKHPRLDQPMSVVDLCFFVAEHDDHHLAAIADIVRSIGPAQA